MKIKKSLSLVLFMILAFTSFAQEYSDEKKYDFPKRNSIYVQNFIIFPTLSYDRVIPIKNNFGVIPKVGFGYYDIIVPIIESSLFLGGKRHFGELGLGWWAFEGAVINANYRYMGKKGLLIKGGFSYIPGEEGFPLLAIGYSFN